MQLKFLMKKQSQAAQFSSASPTKLDSRQMASNNSLVDQQTGLYERHLKKLHDVCLAKLIIAMQAQKEATNSQ